MKDEIQERFKRVTSILIKGLIILLPPAILLLIVFLMLKFPKFVEQIFQKLFLGLFCFLRRPVLIVLALIAAVLLYIFLPPVIHKLKENIKNRIPARDYRMDNKSENKEESQEEMQVEEEKTVKNRTAEKYEERSLLTATEKKFYQYLMKNLEGYDVVVNPKVRLEDILKVVNTNNRSELYKMRGYVKSRHIDFILCDSEMNLICGIEVDDDSHSSEQAKEIDEFKNDIFRKIHKELYRIVKMDKLEEGAKIIVNNLVLRKMIKKKTTF